MVKYTRSKLHFEKMISQYTTVVVGPYPGWQGGPPHLAKSSAQHHPPHTSPSLCFLLLKMDSASLSASALKGPISPPPFFSEMLLVPFSCVCSAPPPSRRTSLFRARLLLPTSAPPTQHYFHPRHPFDDTAKSLVALIFFLAVFFIFLL